MRINVLFAEGHHRKEYIIFIVRSVLCVATEVQYALDSKEPNSCECVKPAVANPTKLAVI